MAGGATYPVAAIARLLNITERRVQQLAADRIIPRAQRGQYPLVGAVQGYVRFLQERVEGGGEGDAERAGPDYTAERTRKVAAEASLAELELARAQGVVVEIELVAREVEAALAAGRARLVGIGARTAPLLALEGHAPACQALVDAAVEEALHEIAAGLPALEEPADADDPLGAAGGVREGDAPAPAADGERVG